MLAGPRVAAQASTQRPLYLLVDDRGRHALLEGAG